MGRKIAGRRDTSQKRWESQEMEKSPGEVFPGALLESELPLLDSIGDDIGHHPNLAALHPDIGT